MQNPQPPSYRRLPVVTTSALKTFRRCPRKYYIEYILLKRPAETPGELSFGVAVHKGLERFWGLRKQGVDPNDAGQAASAEACHSLTDPYAQARATAMLAGYAALWPADRYEVVGVEVELYAPLVNPETGRPSVTYQLGGKLDVIVADRDAGDALQVVEHKTSSEDITHGSDYWRRLRIDTQVSTYLALAQANALEVEAVLYDVLKKPGQVPYKATPDDKKKYVVDKQTKAARLDARQREHDEDPEAYYERVASAFAAEPEKHYARQLVVRLEADAREAAYDVWATAKHVRECELTNQWPRNADGCLMWGRVCPFFDVCSGVDSIENHHRYRAASRAHEELESCP